MRNLLTILVLLGAAAALAWSVAAAQSPPAPADRAKEDSIRALYVSPDRRYVYMDLRPQLEENVRELYVPFEDLNVLLESGPQRILLTRQEYQDLLAKARKVAEERPPTKALLLAADYSVAAGQERAEITGTLTIHVLADGLQSVGLDVAGVGLRAARLDGRGAPLGLADDGRLTLFVEGKGSHTLVLEMVAPIQTTAATQVLNFRLPSPAASRLAMTIPGDVEVKSGAPVLQRVFDEKGGQTRVELLPPRGDVSLVMSLNSRLKRKDRVVVARSVLVDEVTSGYERLHATVSMTVLHRPVDRFRFALPPGFEVTDVRTPLLARWEVQPVLRSSGAAAAEGGTEGDRPSRASGSSDRILDVQLREETTDPVVLSLAAIRTAPNLAAWTLPRLEPLDVAGQVAVVGLLLEDRLKAESIAPEGLIPIDKATLAAALPATVLEAGPNAVRLRPVVAYYAPQARWGLAARFAKPTAELVVTTNLLLTLSDGGQQVGGGFALLPQEEKLFGLDFTVPAGWDVTSVTSDSGPLPFERYIVAGQPAPSPGGPASGGRGGFALGEGGRVHVRFAEGVPAGKEQRVYFQATAVPAGWFGDWTRTTAEFPALAVVGATRDTGAIAVDARDDMVVRPQSLERLTPLDENEKEKYGLKGSSTTLAYRYEGGPWAARLAVERTAPRLTARTYSFLRLERDALAAHYEVVYDVAEARTRRLVVSLPKDTPDAVSIRGLDGVALKEYSAETVGPKGAEERRWTAILAEPRKGRIRLAVDFQERLAGDEEKPLALPVIAAAGVAYQSGLVAVEGIPELDVQVVEHPRRVDVGELVDAEYQPGKRLLGAYGFVGDPMPVKVMVRRDRPASLPPAIIQRAEMDTRIGVEGRSQTAARFLLKTKALYLEVRLPKDSTLWTAALDGKAAKPQREGDRVLLSLPPPAGPYGSGLNKDRMAGAEGAVRDLALVYETPVAGLGTWKRLEVPAPKLWLHAGPETAGEEVPVADLQWRLYLPPGYKVVRSEGTVVTDEVAPPQLAVASLAGGLWRGAGGADFSNGLVALVAATATPKAAYYAETEITSRGGGRTSSSRRSLAPMYGIAKFGATGARAPAAKSPAAPAPAEVVSAGERETAALAAISPAETAAPAKPQVKMLHLPRWTLEGVASLPIDFDRTGLAITFRSLGAEPRLDLTVADRRRTDALALGLALAVLLVGAAMTGARAGRKVGYVLGVALAATLLPIVSGRLELAMVVNGMFYAACLLIPYYLLAAFVRWIIRPSRGPVARHAATAAVVILALAALAVAGATLASADPPPPIVVQVMPPPAPVNVPEDALIVPYDPASKTGIRGVDRLLVPYEKFRALWDAAHPEQPLDAHRPPEPYAMAGAALAATLKGDDFLLFEGYIDIDVYVDGFAIVPLPLEGGVLARADLDGKPARLSVTQVASGPLPAVQAKISKEAAVAGEGGAVKVVERPQVPSAFLVLYASGKGRHRLDLAVRMRLEKQGGWRVAQGWLPAAPATALTLTVPDAGTEVRLGSVRDRRSYETASAGQTIATALGVDGALAIQWRPKVAEGQVDQTLTATCDAAFDVQEDQWRLRWALDLEFRRGQREFFTIELPAGYLVERVEGENVRGWELKEAGGRQTLEVALLKPAKESEALAVVLWRPVSAAAKGQGPSAAPGEFDVPVVGVAGAIRQSGYLKISRSPLLDLRTVTTSGVTRADLRDDHGPRARARLLGTGRVVRQAPMPVPADAAVDESPLGIRPYQAYTFAATPFALRLASEPLAARTSAVVQTILRIGDRERKIESRAILTAETRPLYVVRMAVPADLRLDRVQAPGAFEWALTEEAGRKVLTVYLAAGVRGDVAILVEGRLGRVAQGDSTGRDGPVRQLDVPHIEVLGVDRQEGDIVVQADPATEVRAEALKNIEAVLLARVFGWLAEDQRGLAEVALHYAAPDYAGRLVLAARKPDVSCFTVTNSRVTDRAIEDAILLDWTIRGAGIREVAFLLPAWMKDARVSAPLLRQKTVTPVGPEPAAPVRVRIELQDEVMDNLRVLVENDRLLAPGDHEAPIPVVETGRTDRRYVALESAGRDEVVAARTDGLEPLSRQQKEWAAVAGMLRGGMTQAYLVTAGAERPVLQFHTTERAAVETAGARIGLAQTVLVIDPSGAYRAAQVYRLDNRTEQFLEVEMPKGASLWTAVVAGSPVKPVLAGDATRPDVVRVPLIKTAEGDLDYAVVLKYGGKMAPLGAARVSVEFPIIRTLNINVELSQVELYLPEKYRWFNFRGTTSRVAEEGTFEAGILSYHSKQAEGLIQTLRSSNPFAKARATANLKDVRRSLEQAVESNQSYFGQDLRENKALKEASAKAGAVLTDAVRSIQAPTEATPAAGYNNDFLRQSFDRQRNRRSRNLVTDLGANWAAGPVSGEAPPQEPQAFNDEWLKANSLANQPAAGQAEILEKMAQQAPQRQARVLSQKAQGEIMQRLQKTTGKEEPGQETQQAGQAPRSDTEQLVTRYQQKLEKRGEVDERVATQHFAQLEVIGVGVGGQQIGGFGGLGIGGGGFFGVGPAATAGLASLDVELPKRGTLYRFTTPRGVVEITSCAASVPLLEGLERLGGVVVLVVLVGAVIRLARRRPLSMQAQGTVATVLIILGIVGILFGVLPLGGAAAVILGIVILIRLRRARRKAAAAA